VMLQFLFPFSNRVLTSLFGGWGGKVSHKLMMKSYFFSYFVEGWGFIESHFF